jgi:hypothetical protein
MLEDRTFIEREDRNLSASIEAIRQLLDEGESDV